MDIGDLTAKAKTLLLLNDPDGDVLADAKEGAPLGNSLAGGVLCITFNCPRWAAEHAVVEALVELGELPGPSRELSTNGQVIGGKFHVMFRERRADKWGAFGEWDTYEAALEACHMVDRVADPRVVTDADGAAVIQLPPEFLDLCANDNVTPEQVLRGFIADLCELMNWQANPRADGYSSNGSDERMMARQYYERCGYNWLYKEDDTP